MRVNNLEIVRTYTIHSYRTIGFDMVRWMNLASPGQKNITQAIATKSGIYSNLIQKQLRMGLNLKQVSNNILQNDYGSFLAEINLNLVSLIATGNVPSEFKKTITHPAIQTDIPYFGLKGLLNMLSHSFNTKLFYRKQDNTSALQPSSIFSMRDLSNKQQIQYMWDLLISFDPNLVKTVPYFNNKADEAVFIQQNLPELVSRFVASTYNVFGNNGLIKMEYDTKTKCCHYVTFEGNNIGADAIDAFDFIVTSLIVARSIMNKTGRKITLDETFGNLAGLTDVEMYRLYNLAKQELDLDLRRLFGDPIAIDKSIVQPGMLGKLQISPNFVHVLIDSGIINTRGPLTISDFQNYIKVINKDAMLKAQHPAGPTISGIFEN